MSSVAWQLRSNAEIPILALYFSFLQTMLALHRC